MKTLKKKSSVYNPDYWTIDKLIETASVFHNIKEFKKAHPDAYDVIMSAGLSDDIAVYYKKVYTKKDKEYWTDDKLKEVASQFTNFDEFKKSFPVAIDVITTNCLASEISKHFLKIKQVEPEFLFRKPCAITPEDNDRLVAHRYYNQMKSYLRNGEKLKYMFDDFKRDIDEKMVEPMSWSNFGTVWEITHKKPRISYELNKPSGPKHYALNNLVPKLIESK